MVAMIGQHHDRRRRRSVWHGRHGFRHGRQVLGAVGAFLYQFAHLGCVEGLRMPFVAACKYVHGIAFAGAIHPEAHAAVSAARAGTPRIASRVVHADAADPESAFRHAHAFGLSFALPPAHGYFAFAVAASEYFFHSGPLVRVDIGVLRYKCALEERRPKKEQDDRCVVACVFH